MCLPQSLPLMDASWTVSAKEPERTEEGFRCIRARDGVLLNGFQQTRQ